MQVISLLLVMKENRGNKPSLLVLPASLIGNWKIELERSAPSLRCLFVHCSQLGKKGMLAMAANPVALQKADLVLTTFGALMRQAWLSDETWQLLILDEAQATKNFAARSLSDLT